MLKKLSKAMSVILALTLILTCGLVFPTMPALAAPSGGNSFLTLPNDFTGAATGNTHSGLMGFTFTAQSNITVKALGRPDVIGGAAMTQEHELAIWQVHWNEDRTEKTMPVLRGKVTVSPDSEVHNGYRYGNLETPVKLKAGTEYIITSAEYSGADSWYNAYSVTGKYDPSVIDEIDPVYSADYDGNNIGMQNPGSRGSGQAHVALNFWYEETPAPAAPSGGNSFLTLPNDFTGAATGNTHSGLMGFTFTAKANVTVTALGRPDVIGGAAMTREHELAIWQVHWNEDRTEKTMPVLLGKVTVSPDSEVYNGYCYGNLETPVELIAGNEYIITSAEYSETDSWYNGYSVTGKYDPSVIDEIDPVYSATYEGDQIGMQNPGNRGSGQVHVALNFWYEETPAPAAPAGDNSFLTLPIDFTGADARNTHNGLMGFTFTAKANVTVTALGRPDVIGGAAMTREHELAIWQVHWNEDRTEKTMPVLLGKVTVSPDSEVYNGYCYGNLETPVELTTGNEYIITSTEYYGVDNWLNGYKVTGKYDPNVIGEIDPVYSADYNGDGIGMQNPGGRGADEIHDALNFWYEETPDESDPGSDENKSPIEGDSLLNLPINFTNADVRNTHNGLIGYTFTAKANVSVTALGRPDVIGGAAMTREHELAIWRVEWNEDRTEKNNPVLLGKVTVSPSSPEYNGYRYENLSEPVQLTVGKDYIITSAEYMGSDYWINRYTAQGQYNDDIIGTIDPVYSASYNGDEIGMQDPGTYDTGVMHLALNFWYVENEEVPPTGENSLNYVFAAFAVFSAIVLVVLKRKYTIKN